MTRRSKPAAIVGEMKEFAGFPGATQRYVRRSLDVAERRDGVLTKWARDAVEAAEIVAQTRMYERLDAVRAMIPRDAGILSAEPMMSPLVTLASFDLSLGRLPSFSSFRFLYERLLGGRVRPWLPSAFMAGAGMPHIQPALRGSLLKSLSEAAATASGWTEREAAFVPSWVEKVDG